MPKYIFDPRRIAALHREGRNIMAELRREAKSELNAPEIIEHAFDMQAGSYVERLSEPVYRVLRQRHAAAIAGILDTLAADAAPILFEAGVGEATTLAFVVEAMRVKPARSLGCDISLSRLLHGRHFAASRGSRPELFVADLGRLPLPDNAADIVYTSFALEPNGGRERELLAELLRVTRRHLVLVESSFELGSEETRRHIEENSYARGLPDAVQALGARLVRHERWPHDHNPRNQAAVIVAEKPDAGVAAAPCELVSPVGRSRLVELAGGLFAPDEGFFFPVVAGIPCLLPDNAILASALAEFAEPAGDRQPAPVSGEGAAEGGG